MTPDEIRTEAAEAAAVIERNSDMPAGASTVVVLLGEIAAQLALLNQQIPRVTQAKRGAGSMKAYACPDCEASFTTPRDLGTHRRSIHDWNPGAPPPIRRVSELRDKMAQNPIDSGKEITE